MKIAVIGAKVYPLNKVALSIIAKNSTLVW
jgi:hypothetical protein